MKKGLLLFALITSLFGVSQVFSQTNLLAGLWDGNGITGELSKPNDVGWTNTVSASIPWTVANGSGGCRFRDYNVTGGHTGFTNESDASTSETRQLMFRWDNAAYSASYYGYPVTLETGKYYKFSFDYVLGGSGTPPSTITVGISTTVNGTDRLSSKTFTTTNSTTIYRNGTYDFNVPADGTYYITFNSGVAAWYGVTNLSITEITQADKTALLAQLDIANGMAADPQPVGTSTVYTELNNAITTAQAVYDNINASVAQVLEQENALKVAIAAVNSAIVLFDRISTWTTLPYNATSVIVNPSFESATANNQTSLNGWTNVGGFKTQNNTSFSKKAGTYYVEQWKSSGNWTGLKLSQIIKDLPNGIYKLTAGALNEPSTTGGAFVFANEVKAEVFATNDYTITVTVTNNQLEIGYEVVNGGNYVAVDNFRLSYISDGSPYLIVAPENLFFDLISTTKTFTVSGGNLTANATLTAPAGITLDKTSLTPAEVAAGVTVTATHDGSTAIANGEITISTTGASNSIIAVIAQPDNATSAIVNPNFNNGTTGWTSTTTAQNKTTASNQNVGAFEGTMPFYENWNGSAYTGKIYQVVNNLPAGRYLLKMGVFANNGGEGLFVYGDSYETAVSNASIPAFFEVEFVTPGGSAEIGLNIKSGTNNWVGIDNVSLKYLGEVSVPLTSVSTTNLLLTEANPSKTFILGGANLTADISFVSTVAGVTVQPATVSKDDAELAAGKTITVTFDPTATGAGSLTGSITVSTAGVDDKVITIATSKDSECFTPIRTGNLIPDPYLNTLAPFAGWGHKSIVYGEEAFCGLAAVKFNATTNGYPDGAALDVNNVPWQANTTYRMRAMVKAVDGTFAFFANGTNPNVTISVPQSNDEWVLIDKTFTTGASPTSSFFSFNNVDGASTGKIAYIDNWELYAIETPVIDVVETSIDAFVAPASGTQTKTITVSGTNIVYSIDLALSGDDASMFEVSQSTIAPVDGAVASTEITITYKPTASKQVHEATLTISSASAVSKTFALSGSITPTISVKNVASEPVSSLTFSAVLTGTDSKSVFVSGADVYQNISLELSGTNASMFEISLSTITPVDGTAASTEVSVSYKPTAVSVNHEATLTISSTGAESKTVTLNGATDTSGTGKVNANFYVNQVNGMLIVKGAENYKVYNVQGVKIADVTNNTGDKGIYLNAGVYVVKANNQVQKVLIK